jgi:hypothetical protein
MSPDDLDFLQAVRDAAGATAWGQLIMRLAKRDNLSYLPVYNRLRAAGLVTAFDERPMLTEAGEAALRAQALAEFGRSTDELYAAHGLGRPDDLVSTAGILLALRDGRITRARAAELLETDEAGLSETVAYNTWLREPEGGKT